MESEIIRQRGQLTELTLVAVGLSLGVNLLAAGIVIAANPPGWYVAVAGGIAVAAALAVLIWVALSRTHKVVVFEGLLASKEKESRQLIEIDRYDFSEHITRYFTALSLENKALGAAWATLPEKTAEGEFARTRISTDSLAASLVREAIEYYVLNELSMHLSSYFNNEWDTEKTVTYGRKSIPSVLLDNRFLDLFSRPMEEREVFQNHPSKGGAIKSEGKVVAAFGPGGAYFDDFELVLPKGTKVHRSGPNKIRIFSSRFSLQISIEFHPFGAVLPADFEKLYLGVGFDTVRLREAKVHFEAKFSVMNLLSRSGREHFLWIESFLKNMESKISIDKFLQEIGWNTAHTMAIITSNKSK